MEKMESSYFIMMPFTVLDSKIISAEAKLLYVRIIGLTYQRGYCYAGNEKLAEVHNCSIPTISRLLKELENADFITREFTYRKDSKEIEERRIYANVTVKRNPVIKNDMPGVIKNDTPGVIKNDEDTNITTNNIITSYAGNDVINSKKKKPKAKSTEPVEPLDPTIGEKQMLYWNIASKWPKPKQGNKKLVEKLFLSLSIDDAKLACDNLADFLILFDGREQFLPMLWNYVEKEAYKRENWKFYKSSSKPNNGPTPVGYKEQQDFNW